LGEVSNGYSNFSPAVHSRPLNVLLPACALHAFPAAAGATGLTSSEASLLREVNHVRAAHGLGALRYDATLTRAARFHTREMTLADDFAHGDFAARMSRFRVAGLSMGENLAWGSGPFGTPRGIVDAWLASPGHRANLLRPGFSRIGLGELRTRFLGADDATVVTADFAGS
jgi:uncharacterized protein YkwD